MNRHAMFGTDQATTLRVQRSIFLTLDLPGGDELTVGRTWRLGDGQGEGQYVLY